MKVLPPAFGQWLVIVGVMATTSVGAETSPYAVGIVESIVSDNNYLRRGASEGTPEGLSRSDLISTTSLFGALDQPIGRQRLFGNVTLRAQRLSQNDVYNHNGFSLKAGIDWSTVERISGTVSVVANRTLARLGDTSTRLLGVRNLETTRQFDATARLGMASRFGVEVGYGRRDLSYSVAEFAERELLQQSVFTAVRYRPTGVTHLGMGLRLTRGKYPKYLSLPDGSFEADQFSRRSLELSAHVEPSGASALDLRISFGKRQHDLSPQRDFSGLTGVASWSWRPTGKLNVSTSLTRDPGLDFSFGEVSAFDRGVDFSRLTTALSVRVDYEIGAKVAVNGQFGLARRTLSRSVTTASLPSTLVDSDNTVTVAFGARWLPTRKIELGCEFGSEDRRANGGLSANYRGSTLGCRGQITLQ